MRSAAKRFFIIGASILPGVQFLMGCGETELRSRWLDRDIVVDGRGSEWRGCEAYRDEESGVRIGFFNDGEKLFVFVSTMDTVMQTRILTRGFTVWFDPEGGREEVFGIRYPVERDSMDRPQGDSRRRWSGSPGDGPSRMDPEMIEKMFEQARGRMEVIGPGKGSVLAMSVEDARSQGIEVMIDMTNRVLEYELKIALSDAPNPLYALGVGSGVEIGIGFETGSFAGLRPSGPPPGGMRSGGFPGGGPPGGRGGMGGGMPGGMRKPSEMEPFEFWAKLTLAAGPGDNGSH